ncbi:MAG TPA: Rieske (2Fe-2S) protein [Pseudomonadales bacterium]|nr:Rieske (2Fe-2S) protein [Pseudomonadales bacterium]
MKYLCKQDDIPEAGARGFDTEEYPVFVVKKFGALYAYINSCPHIGVPLEWMPDQFLDNEGELIQCATHGAVFLIETGLCVAGPCTGEALDPVPIVIREDGAIYIP